MLMCVCLHSVRNNLRELVPRLWPFLYHSSESVRSSALKTLDTLTCSTSSAPHTNTSSATTNGEEKVQKEGAAVDLKSEVMSPKSENKIDVQKSDIKSDEMEKENDCVSQNKLDSNKSLRSEIDDDVEGNARTKKESESDKGKESGVADSTSLDSPRTSQSESLKSEFSLLKVEGSHDGDNERTVNNSKDARVSEEGQCHLEWLGAIVQPALVHMYQRALLEKSAENLELVFKVGSFTELFLPATIILMRCSEIMNILTHVVYQSYISY